MSIEEWEGITKIILNILGCFVAIGGMSFITRSKRRHEESVASYLTELKIRLQTMCLLLKNRHPQFYKMMIPPDERDHIEPGPAKRIEEEMERLKQCSNETYAFLLQSKDQYPAGPGWYNKLDTLILFLSDLKNDTYMKNIESTSGEQEINKYLEKTIKTMEEMIEMITGLQVNAESAIFNLFHGIAPWRPKKKE